ncbi:MAG TPA: NAD(P)-dependent oxidoreductase [Ktedonobacterales bacterium]|nr:NAD(P)-dependent oxidoreductase [Ktedonobacterales bacterium]
MKILLTGAFGNIGFSTLQELIKQGQSVRCFDLPTRANRKKARQVAGKVEVVWGDIRHAEQMAALVRDQDVIVHLAAILPPEVDERPEEANDVNVNGTRSLLEAAKQQAQPPKFFFSSSLDVFGFTQDQPPPRKVTDPVQATDAYTRHKLQCEEMIQASGLVWSIYRFADVPPLAARKPHPIMYRIPLDTRFDMLHTTDAGLAIANGVAGDAIWGRVWLVGGGPRCQVYYRDYLGRMMDAMGIGRLPEAAFGHDPYCTDWLDSEESQRILNYQRHTFDEIINDVITYAAPGGPTRLLMPVIRPLVRRWILSMSPYLKAASRKAI